MKQTITVWMWIALVRSSTEGAIPACCFSLVRGVPSLCLFRQFDPTGQIISRRPFSSRVRIRIADISHFLTQVHRLYFLLLRRLSDCVAMPLYTSPIPPPMFDSDESDIGSQQSNDSSSYLSSQFHQHTRLSFSPKFTCNATSQVLPALSSIFDESSHQEDFLQSDFSRTSSEISWQSSASFAIHCSNHKRKRTEQVALRTPNQSPYTRRKNLHHVQENTFQSSKHQRRSRQHDEGLQLSSVVLSDLVNLNPFSPLANPPMHRYHTRLVAKRGASICPALRQLIIARFEQEFRHESFLHRGQFADVALCANRLDGLNYAVKSSKQAILGTSDEQRAWREVCAYAVLSCHEHLVRYYSAWIEPDGRFFLQLEHCQGGSLEQLVEKNREEQRHFHEQELKTLLHQISDVLAFMHGQDLAHLNIKPENILLCHVSTNEMIYKLTDLSHVHQISSSAINDHVDSQYAPLEIVQKCTSKQLDLEKCDIFSLGLTLYVCASNVHLPTEGRDWQELRLNLVHCLPSIYHCTRPFNDLLLERMCHVDPKQRPTAREVCLSLIPKTFNNALLLALTRSHRASIHAN